MSEGFDWQAGLWVESAQSMIFFDPVYWRYDDVLTPVSLLTTGRNIKRYEPRFRSKFTRANYLLQWSEWLITSLWNVFLSVRIIIASLMMIVYKYATSSLFIFYLVFIFLLNVVIANPKGDTPYGKHGSEDAFSFVPIYGFGFFPKERINEAEFMMEEKGLICSLPSIKMLAQCSSIEVIYTWTDMQRLSVWEYLFNCFDLKSKDSCNRKGRAINI